MSEGLTGTAGCGPAPVPYGFYLDGYGRALAAEAFAEALPAAVRCVSCTHSWAGTAFTVTSASGTSSADLKGDKGDKGDPFAYADFSAE